MARCKINYKINDEKYSLLGIIKDNKLTFMENDIKFIIKFDTNHLEMTRENNEYKLKIVLSDESFCAYQLKNINVGKLNIDIVKKQLDIKDGFIEAKYKLDEADFNLKLTYEVI